MTDEEYMAEARKRWDPFRSEPIDEPDRTDDFEIYEIDLAHDRELNWMIGE